MQAQAVQRGDAKAQRLQTTIILAGILILTFVIHALSPVTTSTDSAWTFHVAASILREGDIDLDEYRPLMDLDLDYRLRLIRGHIYSYYPVATPLLVSPVVWLANLAYPLSHQSDFYGFLSAHGPDDRTSRSEKLVASFLVGISAAVMYLVARRFAGSWQAVAITLIFAFSTSMWSTASRALWQHGPSVLFLVTALYLTLAAPNEPWANLFSGMVLAFAYLIRPTNSLSFAFVGLYHCLNGRHRALYFAVGGALVFLLYAGHNWLTYGNVFPPYSYQLFERLGAPTAVLEALAGTLISPARGLFVFTPVFLFAVYGGYLALSRRGVSASNLDIYLICIVVGHWITTSVFEDWGGAWSIGPRYFVDIIPYIMYFLIPVFQFGTLRTATVRFALLATVVASTLIQLHSATSIYPFMWNGKPRALVEAPQRKWEWGDLQFLRGLCRDDPLEGRAPACWMERGG